MQSASRGIARTLGHRICNAAPRRLRDASAKNIRSQIFFIGTRRACTFNRSEQVKDEPVWGCDDLVRQAMHIFVPAVHTPLHAVRTTRTCNIDLCTVDEPDARVQRSAIRAHSSSVQLCTF
eukprot:IDg12930t1